MKEVNLIPILLAIASLNEKKAVLSEVHSNTISGVFKNRFTRTSSVLVPASILNIAEKIVNSVSIKV